MNSPRVLDQVTEYICKLSVVFFRDHCHLTGKYRVPAHSECNINVTQDQSNFIPFIFHNFSNYDCHMVFKKKQI